MHLSWANTISLRPKACYMYIRCGTVPGCNSAHWHPHMHKNSTQKTKRKTKIAKQTGLMHERGQFNRFILNFKNILLHCTIIALILPQGQSLKTFSLRCSPISTIPSVTVDAMHKCHHQYDNLESTCNQSRQILSITLNCKSMISKIEERKLKHGFKDKCHFFHSELRENWHFIRKAFWCSLNLGILKFNLIATIISTMTQSKVII